MSQGNGSAAESDYIYRDEFETLDGKVVSIADKLKAFQSSIGRRVQIVEAKTDGAISDIRADLRKLQRIEETQKDHSDSLARIEAEVIKIGARLAAQDQKLEVVEDKAERASGTNEHLIDQNKQLIGHVLKENETLVVDPKLESLRARQDRRAAIIDSMKGFGGMLKKHSRIVVLVLLGIVIGVARCAGVEVTLPQEPAQIAPP